MVHWMTTFSKYHRNYFLNMPYINNTPLSQYASSFSFFSPKQSGDNDSLGLGRGSSLTDVLGGGSLGGLAGDPLGGLAGGLAGDSLADELESSLPAGAAAAGTGGTEISSTGFIADRQNPNKYYSIAYTEYFMDD